MDLVKHTVWRCGVVLTIAVWTEAAIVWAAWLA